MCERKPIVLLQLVKNGPRSKTVKTCQDNFECLGIVLRLWVCESCCFSRFLPCERHLDRMPRNEEMVRGSDTAAMCPSRKGLQHAFVGSMQDVSIQLTCLNYRRQDQFLGITFPVAWQYGIAWTNFGWFWPWQLSSCCFPLIKIIKQ